MNLEKTKRCPYCGEEILAAAKKCKHCGEWLEEKRKNQVPCKVCGEMIDEDALVCPYCHEKVVFNVSETVSQPVGEHRQVATQYKVSGNPVAEGPKEDAQEQGGIFMHYFFDVIKNHYADFNRSVTRKEFWLFVLFNGLIACALMCLALINFMYAMVIVWIFNLGVLLPSLAMYVCRLRDIGKKWTNLFFLLIPFVGSIILLVFFCTKGKKNNKGNAKMAILDYVIIVLAIVGMIAYESAIFKFMKNAFDDYYYYLD